MIRPVDRILESRAATVAGVAAVIFAAVLVARETGVLMPFELKAHDWLRRAGPDTTAPDRVALVSIGESEIARFGHPLPDAVLAQAIDAILAQAPRAVGIDLYRPTPQSPGDDGWAALERLSARHPHVVFVELGMGPEGHTIPPPSFLERGDQVGLADVLLDPDGVARRLALIQWDEAGPAFSLSLQLARHYLAAEDIGLREAAQAPDTLQLGVATLHALEPDEGGYRGADDAGYQILFDHARDDDAFPWIALSDIVDGRADLSVVRDRIVLLGTDAPSVKDDILTPRRGALGSKGFVVHGHGADQIVRLALGESPLVRGAAPAVENAWIALWCLLGAAIPFAARGVAVSIGMTVLGAGVIVLCTAAPLRVGLWLPPGAALAGWLAACAVATTWVSQRNRRERALVMDLFGRYASRDVAEQLWQRRDEFLEGGRPRPQRQLVTSLLSDLKGYTAAAEKMSPDELMAWVNEYMDAMTVVIERHGGHVDDYVGDGIKANFGVPLRSASEEEIARDARNAVHCALEMGAALARLNETWQRRGEPTGRMRVGLATGPVVVGSIGSQTRLKYTSVGDTINTAARLEGFDKDGFDLDAGDDASEGAVFRVLVSAETHARLGAVFESEDLGFHTLKGKDEPVRIHRILGDAQHRTEPAEENER